MQLPDGYYAIPDPNDARTMTYWRARRGELAMWPADAWHGPARPLRADAPADPRERRTWLLAWSNNRRTWLRSVKDAIEADPGAALHRYATFTVRCMVCGRRLTDALSKGLGIGPDCRRRIGHDVLALIGTPAVAAAHAQQQPATD